MTFKSKIIESGDEKSEPSTIILQGLIDYNKPWLGRLKSFCIYVQDADEHIIGGITGVVDEDRSEVLLWQVWVQESHRGQGMGRQLMEDLEEFALSKQCTRIQLDTFEFQALDFYKKLGYECFATVPEQVCGHDRYYFRKQI
jgi:GNAT superfamily N-acetyltransferase